MANPPDTGPEPAVDRKEQQALDLARAKDAGWNSLAPDQHDSVDGGPVQDEDRDNIPWLSEAAIYQWDDDFGEVGEPNPELEKMLFHDEYLLRAGGAIQALSFDVTVQGPNRINPVRNVSHLLSLRFSILLEYIVRGRRFTPYHA